MSNGKAWDEYFLGIAKKVSEKSKDPSTKVGAVIVRPDHTPISTGFNGFPRGMKDHEHLYANREEKLTRVLHAEENAIIFARADIKGFTIYTWPFQPCVHCALLIIQSGIKRVVAPIISDPALYERWKPSLEKAEAYFKDTGVVLYLTDYKPI